MSAQMTSGEPSVFTINKERINMLIQKHVDRMYEYAEANAKEFDTYIAQIRLSADDGKGYSINDPRDKTVNGYEKMIGGFEITRDFIRFVTYMIPCKETQVAFGQIMNVYKNHVRGFIGDPTPLIQAIFIFLDSFLSRPKTLNNCVHQIIAHLRTNAKRYDIHNQYFLIYQNFRNCVNFDSKRKLDKAGSLF